MENYKKEINKLRIQKVAIDLLSKKSFNSITMDEIAVQSELTKRTVYKYFPSKTAMIASVLESYFERLYDELSSTIASCNSIEMVLIEIARVLFDFTNRNQAFMKIFWLLSTNEFEGEIPLVLIEKIKFWNKNLINLATKDFENKRLTGILVDYPPEQIMHLISAINKGIFIHTNKEKMLSLGEIKCENLQNIFLQLFGILIALK